MERIYLSLGEANKMYDMYSLDIYFNIIVQTLKISFDEF